MNCELNPLMLCVVENVRQKHLDWLNGILASKGWNRTHLARVSKVDPSTLSKFYNDETGSARLNTYTIEKIEKATGIPAFNVSAPAKVRGIAESEAEIYDWTAKETCPEASACRAWSSGTNSINCWKLQSRALENAGYMPGDIMVVDQNTEPRPGDIVCAEIEARAREKVVVFRIFEHPFLVPATMDNSLFKPQLIDNDRVRVVGTIVGTIRPRAAA